MSELLFLSIFLEAAVIKNSSIDHKLLTLVPRRNSSALALVNED